MAKRPRSPQRAADELARARKLASRARKELAGQTKPGDEDLLLSSEWRWLRDLLAKRKPRLMAIRGVVGCGVGFRIKNGVDTGQPCITVLVRRKWSKAKRKRKTTRIPRYFRAGKRRVPVDVVEVGRLERHVDVGSSIGPVESAGKGSVGAYAIDFLQPGLSALTAMHVSGHDQFPNPHTDQVDFAHPSSIDAAAPRPFGTLRRGSMRGIDAALLGLFSEADASSIVPYIGPVAGWRPTTFPGDMGAEVRMFGASSGYRRGIIVNPFVSIPNEDLDAAILVDIDSQFGDSGACIVDADNMILGFLVGQTGSGRRVFCSVSLVLARLNCEILTL
jgi:hypothetical protein